MGRVGALPEIFTMPRYAGVPVSVVVVVVPEYPVAIRYAKRVSQNGKEECLGLERNILKNLQ